MQVTPHIAQNVGRRGGSPIALLRKVRHRGLFKVDWMFTFACAVYNLVRLRNLLPQTT